MPLTAERFDARSWPDDQLDTLFGGAFPAFITADQVAKQYIGRVREWFPELNIILVDDDQVPVATGQPVPRDWFPAGLAGGSPLHRPVACPDDSRASRATCRDVRDSADSRLTPSTRSMCRSRS